MINEARFPQPWIEEPDDPIYEINPCTTSLIKDLPNEIQKRVESYTGSRLGHFKSFKLGTKGVRR